MNKDKRNNIQLLGTLNNADESGIIANANQIYDANEDKSTQDVSKEHTERIKNLEAKEDAMQTTLENITKTGEASAASNVTYNHSDSKLDATNVQQAVDEVRKRSNYNDGDNIIDFNTIHIITDNPEFVCVAVDVNEKILYGIKTDGQLYFGVGCPQQVKDYIDKQINKILGTDDVSSTIDSLKEIEAFLKDFTNSDTLKALLDTKANKTDVDNTIANINADIVDKYKKSNPNDEEGNVIDTNSIKSVINNPEYFKAFVDNTNKLIEAIGLDGVRKFFAGINIQGISQCVIDNPDYTIAWVDKENRIVFAIQHDGNPYFGYGVPKQIKTVIDKLNDDLVNKYTEVKQSLSETKTDIDKKINLGNDVYPSNVHEVSEFEDNISVLLDNLNHILESVGSDGVRKFFAGIEVVGNKFTATDNPEYKAVLLDKDNKIIIGIRDDGDVYFAAGVPKQVTDAISQVVKELEAINSTIRYAKPEILIACIGDSTTEGMGTYGAHYANYGEAPYPARLKTLLVDNGYNGVNVVNYGHSSERLQDVAVRLGAWPTVLTEDIVLPADGSEVSLGTYSKDSYGRIAGTKLKLLHEDQHGDDYLVYLTQISHDTNPITVNGKTIHMSIHDSADFLHQEQSENALTLKAGSTLFTANNRNADVNIIYIGINGSSSLNLEKWIEVNKRCGEMNGGKYIILGCTHSLFNSWSDVIGSDISEKHAYYSRKCTDAFGLHFIDLYQDFFDRGIEILSEAGLLSRFTDAQLANINTLMPQRIVPEELSHDGNHRGDVHLSLEGYQIIGQLLFERLQELNYIVH